MLDFGVCELNARIPAFFQLDRYNISPEDIAHGVLHCEPDAIHSSVIVTPCWKPEVFAEAADQVTEIAPGSVYQLTYRGQQFSLIRSGIGAPQTGDVVLALGCTPCDTLIFTGSVGGLAPGLQIGDLMVIEKSFCGDGFSRYLDAQVVPGDCFLQPAAPDPDLTGQIRKHAAETARNKSVPLHHGIVFSTDSIVAQFCRLEYFAQELGCIGIEMETAAVFRAAKLVGIKAGALLQVSDIPVTNKSLYSGRTRPDGERRVSIRRDVLARIIVDSLIVL